MEKKDDSSKPPFHFEAKDEKYVSMFPLSLSCNFIIH